MAEARQEARSAATGTKAEASSAATGAKAELRSGATGTKRGSEATGVIARDQLRSIVERIERLEEEKQALADDIKEVYGEAKANGFDTKTLRAVIKLRKQDTAERQEAEALLDLYMQALGMLSEAAE